MQSVESTQSVIAFADHITTVLNIDELRLISKALFDTGLPVGWPLSEQPGFSTAGIRLGNLNLELCAVDRQQIALDDKLRKQHALERTLVVVLLVNDALVCGFSMAVCEPLAA